MAISNAWLKSTRGRLAGVTIWNDRQGRTLMREIVTPRNPQTPAQQEQRRLMTTVQTAYCGLKSLCNHTTEGVAAGRQTMGQFYQRNLHLLRLRLATARENGLPDDAIGPLTPIGTRILTTHPYIISQGSLPQVPVVLPEQLPTAGLLTDVAENSYRAVIDAYGLRRGDVLTFVAIHGDDDARLQFRMGHVVLDPRDAEGLPAPLDVPFVGNSNCINLPSPDNEGRFQTLAYADGSVAFALQDAAMTAAGVVVSRHTATADLYSNCQLTTEKVSESTLEKGRKICFFPRLFVPLQEINSEATTMEYYSTNGQAPIADLQKAVVKGLAEDRGLYMPEEIYKLPKAFFGDISGMKFQDIAYNVASNFFGDDVDGDALQDIVWDTLSFDCPVVKVKDNIFALELFHGPTLAFKDVGARFMARLLGYFLRQGGGDGCGETATGGTVNVLVATSGDTGSAVANGFLGVEGIHVYVLYPKGKVSPIQECQFTTLGQNITAVEVDGAFDDCQALVKSAFMDEELNKHMRLTSANSINVARFLPQAFYYFNAYARMKALGLADNLVMCVPSGNFGNICSALFGHAMGLPIKRFIAANNANDVVYNYLQSGKYEPKASIQTLANAMDVGDPSNFARIINLYSENGALTDEATHHRITNLISGATYSDDQIRETMRQCYKETGYILDPHGACGYRALEEGLKDGEVGVFCETAHPAKFKEKVDEILGIDVEIPERLAAFMKGEKQSVPMSKEFADFKAFLMKQ